MEDVDAVGKVVQRRDGKTTSEAIYTEHVNMPIPKNLWRMLLKSTNGNCQELVKLLIQKSQRLKDAAKDSSNLCSAAKKLTAFPGLSLVGDDVESETASKIASDAIKAATKQSERQSSVNAFLGEHAKSLKQLVEGGADITEEFENEFLGLLVSGDPIFESFIALKPPPALSGDVSYTNNYGDNENFVIQSSGSDDTDIEIRPKMMVGMRSSDSGLRNSEKEGMPSKWLQVCLPGN